MKKQFIVVTPMKKSLCPFSPKILLLEIYPKGILIKVDIDNMLMNIHCNVRYPNMEYYAA